MLTISNTPNLLQNEQQIIALKQELEAKANSASGEQLKELTNKIDLLSREAERQRNVISKKPVPE
ncbi:unnamed protein product [Anisakis simplex]|uniref:Uncharacterized protein n=1 Tax=Anisakis simplex TaxID=6269 RepID=A0A3P6QBI7_ANISI|nr:unnamed protein product [Anisakis simplex]